MEVEHPSNALPTKQPLKGRLFPDVNQISSPSYSLTIQAHVQDAASDTIIANDNHLIASPYTDQAHLLDLTTLDRPNQLLARALSVLQPTRDDYATACYLESFNWPEVIDSIRRLCSETGYSWTKRSFYVIVFRSQLYANADSERLYELDAQSHREAVASGGLLKYWFGTTNANRENLATCIWRNQRDARLGGTGPWHQRARTAIDEFYERITLTRLRLEIGDDVKSWGFSEWKDEIEGPI
ncbi:UPF0643 protein PB2B2.08 [Aspergillus terreus]|uniref:UPF0643 protein PB2B2.08 n=1 Tax=Aspergillus terreus TaxID=33178 RepID=A0A5M3YV00_ASPTE|nr:hypothetical protein ATETN484_0003010400 [Aspergillus terreus]GFF14112.1 UPF0643 protein PB2B2.08 [Aspergillus terreus]